MADDVMMPDTALDTGDRMVAAAREAVAAFAKAAAVAGASPLPFSDALVLVPIEVAMISRITVIFQILPRERAVITTFVTSILGTAAATVAGRSIASNLLKFFPGFGSVAGGVISGATAASLTTAIGMAYIELMKSVRAGEVGIDSPGLAERMKELLRGGAGR